MNSGDSRSETTKPPIAAVLWDFGGVILTSPFDAFTKYERSAGLPDGLIRTINSTNPDTNAWAKLERSEVTISEFAELFNNEAATHGHTVDGRKLLSLLHGEVRPQMVEALRRVKAAGYKVACLTNNITTSERGSIEREEAVAAVMAMFDHVTESRHMGVRKPEVRFYEMACEALEIFPSEAVFLDDLGINLKPAAALGMRTIKVVDPDVALDELSSILNLPLR
jgi:putative hydrolase of the HAD superfamily